MNWKLRKEGGPYWYLADDGFQGAFYYESDDLGEPRVGAYLYPDFSTAVLGLWEDHVLLQVNI